MQYYQWDIIEFTTSAYLGGYSFLLCSAEMTALSLNRYPVATAPAPMLAMSKPRLDIILANELAIFTPFLVKKFRRVSTGRTK